MMIVNADDWGRSKTETDSALACCTQGRITSVSAMVFMEDSERGADIIRDISVGVGLHLNLSQEFTAPVRDRLLQEYHARIRRYLGRGKYALVAFHPALRQQFRYVYQAQFDEFVRLYGKQPSHVDGHHHRHLCANILLDDVIPNGQKVRRNFSPWPDDKRVLNMTYRRVADSLLARRYRLTDFFFALSQCVREDRWAMVAALAESATVEIMTHPANAEEFGYLMSARYLDTIDKLEMGSYSAI